MKPKKNLLRAYERNLKLLALAVREETNDWWISDIAKATGLSWGTVKNFITGKTKSPHYLTVYRMAAAFDITMRIR
jgi:transcriptional regulator with XRE-family HTH domain